MGKLTRAVPSSPDDGYRLPGNYVTISDLLYAGRDTAGQLYGTAARFADCRIPAAATIVQAYISLYSQGKAGGPQIKIYANDVDDATAPTNETEFNALVLTTAAVDWDPAEWTQLTWYDSPDITTVIQELVNRPGWTLGNHIQIVLKNDIDTGQNYIVFSAWDDEPNGTIGPILFVKWAGKPTSDMCICG